MDIHICSACNREVVNFFTYCNKCSRFYCNRAGYDCYLHHRDLDCDGRMMTILGANWKINLVPKPESKT